MRALDGLSWHTPLKSEGPEIGPLWWILRNADVRDRRDEIQNLVPGAADLSTLHVLDIIVWMSSG